MARAMQLARKGLYTTDPNPCVGCVLVRNNQIIAEGWHQRAGHGHAEIEALQQAANAAGATAYVTLEPCSHQGKTPPCCEALIAAGVKRVVAAMQDPNPLVSGNGLKRLREVGVAVECGLLQADAEKLNRGFTHRMRTGLPFVFSKLAMSLDGRTAMATGESKWITSEHARLDVHRYRAASSAILTGINTVLADDPSMTARLSQHEEILQPLRCVLDTHLRMPLNARMASLPGRSIIVTCSDDENKITALRAAGFEVYTVAQQHGRVDLTAALQTLAKLEVNEVMVEAGAELNGALLNQGLVNEWVVYMAPSIMGDGGRGLMRLPGLDSMADKVDLKILQVRQVGRDLKIILSSTH